MTEHVVDVVGEAYEELVDGLEAWRPDGVSEEAWGAATVGALLGILEAIQARYTAPEQRVLLETHREAARAATVELAAATDRAVRKSQN